MPKNDILLNEQTGRILKKVHNKKPIKRQAESSVASEQTKRIEQLKRLIGEGDDARKKVDGLKSYLRFVRNVQITRNVVLANTGPNSELRLDLHQAISPLGEDPLKRPLAHAMREVLKGPVGAVLEPKLAAINDELLKMADEVLVEPQRPYAPKRSHTSFHPPGLSKMLHDFEALTALDDAGADAATIEAVLLKAMTKTPMTGDALCDKAGVSRSGHARGILSMLKKMGLCKHRRGKNGGYYRAIV